MPKTWEVELEDGRVVEIESDSPPGPDQINIVKQQFSGGSPQAAPTEEKGFLDRLGESSNLVKALKSPLETVGNIAKSAMPQNAAEWMFPPLATSRMALEGIKGYGEDTIEREKRLFNKMNEDPDSAALTAGQMLVAPIPFAGKLVEPLEEDITAGNLSGAAGSVGGVALDALAARVAPEAMKAPGAVARGLEKNVMKPLGQKIYSGAVAREAARKSLPHVPNPTPYIRNPYNPIMLGQDALRAGTNIAKSSRVEALQKALGKKLNPDVVGVGKNKPGVSGIFGDTQSIDDFIDAEDSAKFKADDNFNRKMTQERLNYSPRDFQNPIDKALSLDDFDPTVSSDTPLNRALRAREAPIPEFVAPESTPRRGISAERGRLAQFDPQGINPDALEPPIPPSLEEQWAQQLIEEEAGGRPALAPVDSIDKGAFGSQNPKGSQDFTSDQILQEQNRIQRMLEGDKPPAIEAPPDAPVIEKPVDAPVIEGIREQLIAKGIPESLVDKMTPEQMQMALQRKGTRASGTNPRALRGESSLPKADLRTDLESEIVSLGQKLKELRPTANTVKGFRKLEENAYGKATGKYGEGEAHLDFDQIMRTAEENVDSRGLKGEARSKAIAQDVATKSVDATLHEAAHGPSKGHGADFHERMQDLRESLGRGGYERMVKSLRDKILASQ